MGEMEANAQGRPHRAIVLSASSISFVDSTAMQVMLEMVKSCQERGVRFYIAGAYGGPMEFFTKVLKEVLKHNQEDFNLTIDECIQRFEQVDVKQVGRTRSYKRRHFTRPLPFVIVPTQQETAFAPDAVQGDSFRSFSQQSRRAS